MKIEKEFASDYLEISYPIVDVTLPWAEAKSMSHPDRWRMPTRAELVTMFDYARDSGYEFNDKSPVWSGSSYFHDLSNAWVVYFYDGTSLANDKSNGAAVRLVREVKR